MIPTGNTAAAVQTTNESASASFQSPKRPLGKTGLECSILAELPQLRE